MTRGLEHPEGPKGPGALGRVSGLLLQTLSFFPYPKYPMVLDPEDTLVSDDRLGLWVQVTEGTGLQEGHMPRPSHGVWSRGHSYIHLSAVSWCAVVPSSDPTCKGYSPQQSCPQL